MNTQPVFRFAPSPNGYLHLGHAYSALLNFEMARETGGRMLVRVEDIDTARCRPDLERQMLEDLRWLGIEFEEPVRRQSDHFADYTSAIDALVDEGLVYRSVLSRGDLKRIVEAAEERGDVWPRDPDGAPLHPGRNHEPPLPDDAPQALRLDMKKALEMIGPDLDWAEEGEGPDGETGHVSADPSRWGDIVLARKETPTSYHVSVVVDDALQGVTHVVRGRDLFYATEVHVLLQALLGLPQPVYHHHDLILADDALKLSKSRGDTSIKALREAGLTPEDVRRMVGFAP